MRVWKIGRQIFASQKGTVLDITVLEERDDKRYYAKGEIDLSVVDFWEMVRDALSNVFKEDPERLEVLKGVYDDLDLLLTKSTKPKRVILVLRDGAVRSSPILVVTSEPFEKIQEEVYRAVRELRSEKSIEGKISFADIVKRLEEKGVIRPAHFDAVYEVMVDVRSE